MALPIAATAEQIKSANAWIKGFYEACDSSDIQLGLTEFYQPDAVLTIGNQPPLKGHKEIFDYFEKDQAVISSKKHEIKHVDVISDRIYAQVDVTFIIKNDPKQEKLKFKAVTVFWKKVDEDKVSSIDAYVDLSPVIEKIKMYS